VELAKHLPVATIADMVNEHDTRLWRFIKHYVDEARSREDYSNVTAIGIDETSKKGHKYVTVVVDLNQRKVIYVTNGKDSTTVDNFAEDFAAHKGDAEAIKIVTCDMSLSFKKGINEHFTNSSTVIDKFHVIKHINEAIDEVRREEQRQGPWYKYLLNKTKYLWLKNDANLTGKQHERKESLLKKRLKTARAYTMRVTLQDIYELSTNRTEAEKRLKQLCNWITRSRLAPMKKFGELLKNHWEEILNYFDHRYTNAILEGMNSIIQNIKRRARGFRNDEFFKTMIYLGCGKLDLNVAK
jgi:transposase